MLDVGLGEGRAGREHRGALGRPQVLDRTQTGLCRWKRSGRGHRWQPARPARLTSTPSVQ
jgi:hypothetical protein